MVQLEILELYYNRVASYEAMKPENPWHRRLYKPNSECKNTVFLSRNKKKRGKENAKSRCIFLLTIHLILHHGVLKAPRANEVLTGKGLALF